MARLTDRKPTTPTSVRTRMPGAGVLVLALLIAAFVAVDAFACPTCKDAVNTSDVDGLNVARGYFYSILLMLAMPFTLVGSFSAYVWREMRRQKAAATAGEPQERSAP